MIRRKMVPQRSSNLLFAIVNHVLVKTYRNYS